MHVSIYSGFLLSLLHHHHLLLLLLGTSSFLGGTVEAGIGPSPSPPPTPTDETLASILPAVSPGGYDDNDDDGSDDGMVNNNININDDDDDRYYFYYPWRYSRTTNPLHAVLVNGNFTYDDDQAREPQTKEVYAPENWDRKCLWLGAEPGPIDREWHHKIAVYARDWGDKPHECGIGLLDNIRVECNCMVRHWGCDRVNAGGGRGIWATFNLAWHGYAKGGGVQRAFLIASNFEYAPQSLQCCMEGDPVCEQGSPGWIGHTNLTDPAQPPPSNAPAPWNGRKGRE